MKSVFLTILIFAGVFLFAGSNVLSVLGQDWFQYMSYTAFAAVMLAGIYVTMLHKPSRPLQNRETENPENENLKITHKEEDYDEK